jgi:Ca-activated chloride channel family protein
MKLRLLFSIFALAVICSAFSSVNAQGVIIPIRCDPRPCPRPPLPRPAPLPNVLPVKSINLDTVIKGQVATTHVTQVFHNDTNFTLEGTYFFPIPETASIVEFSIWENGKKLTGEVRTREEARRIYDQIVRTQRDPGLLEYAGKNLFQASIFPIPAGSDKKLELVYSEVLKADSGTVSYRYPLGTGRNLWRPQPMPLPMPRTSNTTTSVQQKFGTISGKIEIIANGPLRNVYSPTHSIDLKMKSEKNAVVTFETMSNDSDIQLYYGVSDTDFGMTLMTYREAGKDGFFLLMLSPKDELGEKELINKDIVFVLDTSGSMADEGKMDKARSALLFGIRTLNSGDRFNVINFAGEEHLMETKPIAANDAGKKKGEEFVNKLRPTGGTNINDTLVAAMAQFEDNDRPKMLVFMTDGLPTIGVSNVEKIVENLNKAKKADVRIFPFGFGYDVNTTLLDRIGSENGGVSDYVQPKEDLEVKVSNFFSRVSSPVLSDIKLDLGGVNAEMMYPQKLTDIFKGMQLTIIGRYKNDEDLKNIRLRLSGKTGKADRSYNFDGLSFPARASENDFLPRLWASRRVGWLIEQIRNNGENKELKDEVIDLGTRYGIVTPYTSYLAADGNMVNAVRGSENAFIVDSTDSKIKARSGADAVRQSMQQNMMQANVTAVNVADDPLGQIITGNSAVNQFVANKNFVLQDNVWIDGAFEKDKALPEKRVEFASKEYFDLVEQKPELASYFALGEEVVVVIDGTVYRVVKAS